MDGFLAQIMMFGGDFAPRGWAFCHGQLLPISQHIALFSVLGNRYGGDGKASFALPDLRGRVPVGTAPSAREDRRVGVAVGEPDPGRHPRPQPAPPGTLNIDFIICIEGDFPQRP